MMPCDNEMSLCPTFGHLGTWAQGIPFIWPLWGCVSVTHDAKRKNEATSPLCERASVACESKWNTGLNGGGGGWRHKHTQMPHAGLGLFISGEREGLRFLYACVLQELKKAREADGDGGGIFIKNVIKFSQLFSSLSPSLSSRPVNPFLEEKFSKVTCGSKAKLKMGQARVNVDLEGGKIFSLSFLSM